MVIRKENAGISVRAIIGARAILLAMDATAAARRGLLGFAIGQKKQNGDVRWLNGFKFFEETVSDPQPGESRSTREHPIQSFLWGDYNVKPNTRHEIVVQPVRGTPTALEYGESVNLKVTSADEESGDQSVLFNRGAIPSQAFERQFGNVGPTEEERDDPENSKVKWLSRGLLEGALKFIKQARSSRYEVHVAAYEFYYKPILEALRAAADRGATIRVIYDGGDRKRDELVTPTAISTENIATIEAVGLDRHPKVTLHPRTRYSAITHNKFIVLLHNNQPIQVWTGSTNFTSSGFLGQSNLAHIVRREDVATAYEAYWQLLATDPATRAFKSQLMQISPEPDIASTNDIATAFSPRRAGMMEWYAERFRNAQYTVMFTAAFGVAPQIAAELGVDRDYLRFIMMERRDGNLEEQTMVESDRDTIVSLGERLNSASIRFGLPGHALDQWFKEEEHFRTKGHIFYVHTKFLLVDCLNDFPLIFTGSANFSDNSVESNDENMLLLKGPAAQEVAELYTAEFQRLHNHLYFRTIAIARMREIRATHHKVGLLDSTDGWTRRYFQPGSYQNKRRELFR